MNAAAQQEARGNIPPEPTAPSFSSFGSVQLPFEEFVRQLIVCPPSIPDYVGRSRRKLHHFPGAARAALQKKRSSRIKRSGGKVGRIFRFAPINLATPRPLQAHIAECPIAEHVQSSNNELDGAIRFRLESRARRIEQLRPELRTTRRLKSRLRHSGCHQRQRADEGQGSKQS